MKFLSGCLLLIGCAALAFAGNPANDAYIAMDTANVITAISNFGNYGNPNAVLPSFEWPAGSNNDYLWEGRFWAGARLFGASHVSHADYGDYEWHPPDDDPFYLGPGLSDQDFVTRFDDAASFGNHFPLYLSVDQRALSWDHPVYGDFIGVELSIVDTGSYLLDSVFAGFCFDCDVATRDFTTPHMDDWVDYDGDDGPDSDTDRRDWVDPLDRDGDGLTGYDTWGWPWAEPLNPLYDSTQAEPDGIYDEYYFWADPSGPEVLGQPGTVYAGQVLTDATGAPLHGWLLPRSLSYMFDGDDPGTPENDTGERDLSVPCTGFIGTAILYCPTDTTVSAWSHQWWDWDNDPDHDSLKYAFMAGTHSFSAGRRFIPRPDLLGEGPFDYRYLLSCGPYDLVHGDTLKLAAAHCMGEGLQGLRDCADSALALYYAGAAWSSPVAPSAPDQDTHWIIPPAAVPPAGELQPRTFALHHPHPNPFNPTTALGYELRAASHVTLRVYDTAGREVAGLVDDWRDAGVYEVTFEGTGLASGIYLARLEAGDFTQVQKLVLLK
ncbi:MAG: T9SS C-terminal target domain-containing protein [Candidatus Zixiibacteriota bacterium]|nr:MAG: T9SS C-terminal target domain-containing protein [candidate division Zixibacteria bacterium]